MVRHGESQWNRERRWQGRADSPLTAEGRVGSAVLAEALAALAVPPGGTIWSSPSSRAGETAAIIGARLGLAVAADDRLVERDVGPWQGLTAGEIESAWPGHLAARRWPAGAESLADVAARAAAALASIAARAAADDGTTLVVSHGGLIRCLIRFASDRDAVVPNLGGAWFTVSPPEGLVEVGDLFGARAVEPDDDAAPARL
jgi:probable phosphoglycerate mutase